MSTAQGATTTSSTSSIAVWLPVRFTVAPTYFYSANTLGDYKKEYEVKGTGLSADFEIPFAPLPVGIGITGFGYLPDPVEGVSDKAIFIAPYLNIIFGGLHVLMGPLTGSVGIELENTAAAPNHRIEYDTTVKGGFLGLRTYLGDANGPTLGLGFNFFYGKSDEYTTTTTAVTGIPTEVKTKYDSETMGGSVNLIIGFGTRPTEFGRSSSRSSSR